MHSNTYRGSQYYTVPAHMTQSKYILIEHTPKIHSNLYNAPHTFIDVSNKPTTMNLAVITIKNTVKYSELMELPNKELTQNRNSPTALTLELLYNKFHSMNN